MDAMFVAVARLVLQIPDSGSLKSKRQVLRKVTDRLKARFNVSVAEVDDQDLWQRATLALAVVGGEQQHVDEQLAKVIHFVEEMYVAPLVSRQTEIIPLGDRLYTASAASRPGDGGAGDGDEEGADGETGGAPAPELSAEELIAQLGRPDRSLAEAEGLPPFEARRPAARPLPPPAPAAERPAAGTDDLRARARALRNPRDWEKK